MAFKDFFTQVPQEGGTKTSTFETLIDAIVKGYVTAKKDDPKARKFGEIYSVAKQAEAGIEQVQSRRQSEEVKKLFRDAALSMDDVYSKTDISHDERLSRARNIKNNFFKLALPKSQNDDVLKYGKAMDKRIKEWEKEGISVNKMKDIDIG